MDPQLAKGRRKESQKHVGNSLLDLAPETLNPKP